MKKFAPGSMLALALCALPSVSNAQIVVELAPPPPQVEVPPAVAVPGSTWIPGFWEWDGRQYVWQRGRWDNPPEMGARWVPARWVRRGGRWMFMPGRWRGRRGFIVTPGAPGMVGAPGTIVGPAPVQAQPQTVFVAPQQPVVVQQPPVVVQQPPVVVQQPPIYAPPQQPVVVVPGRRGWGRRGGIVVAPQQGPGQPVVVARPAHGAVVVPSNGQPVVVAPRRGRGHVIVR